MHTNYKDIITLEEGKRGGKPCIRNLRITFYDVLSWLAQRMKPEKIIDDYPELNLTDISACFFFRLNVNDL